MVSGVSVCLKSLCGVLVRLAGCHAVGCVWSLCLVWCCRSLCGSLWSSLAVGAVLVWLCVSGCLCGSLVVLCGGVFSVSGGLVSSYYQQHPIKLYTYEKTPHIMCSVLYLAIFTQELSLFQFLES